MMSLDNVYSTLKKIPLIDRLAESNSRIGKMCSEHRTPRMTIPVQWDDDDFFICYTIREAIAEVQRLREELSAFRKSEKELSDAYLRIRELVGAWDTKPGGEDRFEVTEAAVKRLREDEKRLDWLECRAMNKYLLGFWADNGGTLRDAIDAEMK